MELYGLLSVRVSHLFSLQQLNSHDDNTNQHISQGKVIHIQICTYLMAQPEKASYRGKIPPSNWQAKTRKMRPSHHCPVLSSFTYTNAQHAQNRYKLLASQCDSCFFGPMVKGHRYKPKGESSPFNASGPSQTGSVGIR